MGVLKYGFRDGHSPNILLRTVLILGALQRHRLFLSPASQVSFA